MSSNPNQIQQDIEHLRLLSIFHTVVACIVALFSMFPCIHIAFGIGIVSGALGNGPGKGPPAAFGWLFILLPAMMVLCGLAMAVSIVIAGQRLRENRSYTYCLVVACLECMFMPLGTVLGVLTIVVLMQPSVKELFGVSVTGAM